MATNDTINLNAATRNFSIEQGATVEVPFALTRNGEPFDLSEFSDVRLQVRRSYSTAWIINATLANGKMVWTNREMGQFKLVLQPNDTAEILFKKDEENAIKGVYDLELQDASGDVYKGCKGSFTINREVTRV